MIVNITSSWNTCTKERQKELKLERVYSKLSSTQTQWNIPDTALAIAKKASDFTSIFENRPCVKLWTVSQLMKRREELYSSFRKQLTARSSRCRTWGAHERPVPMA